MEAILECRIVIVPSPGLGHLIPLVELAKLLLSRHRITATFLLPSIATATAADANHRQLAVLNSLPENIDYVLLPPVNFLDLPEMTRPEVKMWLAVTRSIPSVRAELQTVAGRTRVTGLVTDAFGFDLFDVAREFNVPPYMCWSANAMSLVSLFYLPELDRSVDCEYQDLPDLIRLPGCVPIHGRDLVEPTQDRKGEGYRCLLHMAAKAMQVEGILLNSCIGLEPGPIQALQMGQVNWPPVYPIGPILQSNQPYGGLERPECLRWLDNQPTKSVLFVCFGSGGTLSHEQLHELALGLEMSKQRFLWVVKSPNDKSSSGSYFNNHNQQDSLGFLPQDFVERTKGLGLVVPSWAPQVKILAHHATGGFLTHCGWNSVQESITHGVPMIAWPLYAEQRMNAVMMTEGLKVALRPKEDNNGCLKAEEITRVVKELMEGQSDGTKVQDRVKDLGEAARRALSADGTSTKSMAEVALKLRNHSSITTIMDSNNPRSHLQYMDKKEHEGLPLKVL